LKKKGAIAFMKKLNTLVAAVSLGITASFAVLPAASAHSSYSHPSYSHPSHLHPPYLRVSHVKKPSHSNLTKVCEQVKEIKDVNPVKIYDGFKVVGLVVIHPGCDAAIAYSKSSNDYADQSSNDYTDQSYDAGADQSYGGYEDQSYSDDTDQSYNAGPDQSYSDYAAPSYSDYAEGDEGYQARSNRRISIN
jgi:hypothetical protein